MEISGPVTEGNLSGQDITLACDAGIFVPCRGARVTTNGLLLTVSTEAHHGIEIDGTREPTAILANPNVLFTVPVYPGNATWEPEPVRAPSPLAAEVRRRARDSSGEDGLAAFDWFIPYIHANPNVDRITARDAWIAWSEPAHNLLRFDTCVDSMLRNFIYEGAPWEDLTAMILSMSVEAWRGEDVIEVPRGS